MRAQDESISAGATRPDRGGDAGGWSRPVSPLIPQEQEAQRIAQHYHEQRLPRWLRRYDGGRP
jgi:hypothetical protein